MGLLLWWIFGSRVDHAFGSWIWPLLGLIFLPFTTLMWVLLDAPPVGVHGFDWFWIVIAVLLDLSHYAGAYGQREQFPGRTSTA